MESVYTRMRKGKFDSCFSSLRMDKSQVATINDLKVGILNTAVFNDFSNNTLILPDSTN